MKEAKEQERKAHLRNNKLILNNKVYRINEREKDKQGTSEEKRKRNNKLKRKVFERSPAGDSTQHQTSRIRARDQKKN